MRRPHEAQVFDGGVVTRPSVPARTHVVPGGPGSPGSSSGLSSGRAEAAEQETVLGEAQRPARLVQVEQDVGVPVHGEFAWHPPRHHPEVGHQGRHAGEDHRTHPPARVVDEKSQPEVGSTYLSRHCSSRRSGSMPRSNSGVEPTADQHPAG